MHIKGIFHHNLNTYPLLVKTNGVPLNPATAAVFATSTMYSSDGVSENENEFAILFATRDPV